MNENKDRQDFFENNEEKYLKQYFSKLDESLGVKEELPARLESSFNNKLISLESQKESKILNWKSFSASVASAFSIGLLLARFLFMPSEVATRGVGNTQSDSYENNEAKVIILMHPEPEKFAINAISEAYDTDLEITTFKIDGKVQISIKPLRAFSKEQSKVRNLLDIKEDVSGEVTVIIKSTP